MFGRTTDNCHYIVTLTTGHSMLFRLFVPPTRGVGACRLALLLIEDAPVRHIEDQCSSPLRYAARRCTFLIARLSLSCASVMTKPMLSQAAPLL